MRMYQREKRSDCFGDTDIKMLEGALHDTWEALRQNSSRPWSIGREEVARQVIAIAADGERDQSRVTKLALARLTGAND